MVCIYVEESGSGHDLNSQARCFASSYSRVSFLARVSTPLVHLLNLNHLSIFPADLSPLSGYPVAAPYPVRLWGTYLCLLTLAPDDRVY